MNAQTNAKIRCTNCENGDFMVSTLAELLWSCICRVFVCPIILCQPWNLAEFLHKKWIKGATQVCRKYKNNLMKSSKNIFILWALSWYTYLRSWCAKVQDKIFVPSIMLVLTAWIKSADVFYRLQIVMNY